MQSIVRLAIGGWLLMSLFLSFAIAEENPDVTISSDYFRHEEGQIPSFYLNERAVGKTRAGFQVIVDHVRTLPKGASIVWGPNYDRCGACSGAEVDFHPIRLYPDLWRKLLDLVTERQLTLSSTYPGPFVKNEPRNPFPKVFYEKRSEIRDKVDAFLGWELELIDDSKVPRNRFEGYANNRFYVDGEQVSNYDTKLFLSRLPADSHVVIKLRLTNTRAKSEPNELAILNSLLHDGWRSTLAEQAMLGKIKVSLVAPAELRDALNAPGILPRTAKEFSFEWSNYHGPTTPHEEVLYYVNGEFVGRGDQGFDQVLTRVKELPLGSRVERLGYRYSGSYAAVRPGSEQVEAINEKLLRALPFAPRKRELDLLIAERQLTEFVSDISPANAEPRSVRDWQSGERHPVTGVATGRLVRYDQKASPATAALAWTDFDASQIREGRKPESTATYTINDKSTGRGFPGFAKAMEQLEKLPAGSVVHVRLCVRTKGPFTCPLTYYGQRHFERTGYEPYFGMFPWLVDVAKKQNLKIEWIPDEKQSCGDCELNK